MIYGQEIEIFSARHEAQDREATREELTRPAIREWLTDYPKMPGEPPCVQPSRKNPLNWDDA